MPSVSSVEINFHISDLDTYSIHIGHPVELLNHLVNTYLETWPLKWPSSKAFRMSESLKEQIADPARELSGVVKVA